MLKIDQIDQSSTHTYHFPTIDFKFQNTGTAAAFLWKFVIEVLHTEIDTTPVLDFDMEVKNGGLYILASNHGWGTAYDCHIRVAENILSQLYADSMLQYMGVIQSGERKAIVWLETMDADQTKFGVISRDLLATKKYTGEHEERLDDLERETPPSFEWWDRPKDRLGRPTPPPRWDPRLGDNSSVRPRFHHTDFLEISEDLANHRPSSRRFTEKIRGIKLTPVNITWNCRDDKDIRHSDTMTIAYNLGHGYEEFFLTEEGFYSFYHPFAGIMDSDVTYSTILDPSKGSHERAYPISRKVSSGDVERFHIMVGAPMSCHLAIRFKFFIDQATIVESEVFDVKIWNPRNSQWHSNYKDGEALSRILYERSNRKTQQVIKDDTYDLDKPRDLQLFTHYEEALAAYEAERFYNQGLVFHDLKQYDAALTAYNQAIQLNPKHANSYFCKGVVLYNLKHYNEGILAYEKAVRLGLNSHDLIIRQFSRYEQVLTADLAIHKNPDDAGAYVNKGNVLFNLKEYEEALAAYEQATQVDNDNADIYIYKGDVLMKLQRYEEALINYEQAIQLKPNPADAFYKKGHALKRLGKLEEAQLAYETARQLRNN
jgi:tetratricopeptide (TPR) repeat protein